MSIRGDFKQVGNNEAVGSLTGWPAVPRVGDWVVLPSGRWKVLLVVWEDLGDNDGLRVVVLVERRAV